MNFEYDLADEVKDFSFLIHLKGGWITEIKMNSGWKAG